MPPKTPKKDSVKEGSVMPKADSKVFDGIDYGKCGKDWK